MNRKHTTKLKMDFWFDLDRHGIIIMLTQQVLSNFDIGMYTVKLCLLQKLHFIAFAENRLPC